MSESCNIAICLLRKNEVDVLVELVIIVIIFFIIVIFKC